MEANIIGFYLGFMPRPLEPFASMLTCGLISRLNFYKKDLLVYGTFREEPQDEIYEALASKSIDGLIFIPPRDHPLTSRLANSDFPVIAIADSAPGIVSVVVDDEMGAFMLAEHLALRGYRRVMFRKDPFGHPSAVKRLTAFVRSAEYLGLDVKVTLPADAHGALSAEEELFMRSRGPKKTTAVVCWADAFAYAVMKYCKAHNLQVPSDVAVAGFDGISPSVEPVRRLTSIQAPWFRVAEKAVDLLVQLSAGLEINHETVLPIDLVLGDTT